MNKNVLWFVVGIGAIMMWLGWTWEKEKKGSASPDFVEGQDKTLDSMYKAAGNRWGVDWLLLKVIAQVESNENPGAKNPNDPSYGLMQLLCVPDGKGGCSNRLNVIGWPPEEGIKQLYDPEYSLKIGAQILAWNIGRFGLKKGIAVYNSWSAHTAPNDGPFPNQSYVDKVLTKYRALGG